MKSALWEDTPGALVALINTGQFVYAHLYTVTLAGGMGALRFTDADLDILGPADTATIDLDFAGGQVYGVDAFTDVLTCTRASPAVTYAQKQDGTLQAFAANELRITDMGLLIEELRENRCLQSQTLTAAGWSNAGTTASVVANTTVAPDGTMTADTITFGSGAIDQWMRTNANYVNGITYAISGWAKVLAGTRNFRFKFNDGAVNAFSSNQLATTAWQKFSASFTASASTDGQVAVANGSVGVAGDLIVWGVQVEVGAVATSYIPTTTVAVTRDIDAITLTGDLDAIFRTNASSGLITLGYASNYPLRVIASLDGGLLYSSDGGIRWGGGTPTQLLSAASWLASLHGVGWSYDTAAVERSLMLDGGAVVDEAALGTWINTIYLGTAGSGNIAINGYISRFAVWDKQLDTEALRSITATAPDFPAVTMTAYDSRGIRVDQEGSRTLAHWKRGLDVDSWLLVVMPRYLNEITGAEFPDTINGVPWVQAAMQGALDGADIQVDRAYFSAWPQPYQLVNTPVGILTVFAGRAAEVDCGDIVVAITINDYRELLNIKMPRNTFQGGCRFTLYDTGCTLSELSFDQTGTVIAGSTQKQILSAPIAPGGARTFQLGKLKMTSGLNDGFSRTISTWVSTAGGTFSLLNPFPFEIAVGDTFTVYPGCDKTQAACTAFANSANFGGQPFIPAPETAI